MAYKSCCSSGQVQTEVAELLLDFSTRERHQPISLAIVGFPMNVCPASVAQLGHSKWIRCVRTWCERRGGTIPSWSGPASTWASRKQPGRISCNGPSIGRLRVGRVRAKEGTASCWWLALRKGIRRCRSDPAMKWIHSSLCTVVE